MSSAKRVVKNEQCGASKLVSSAREKADGRATGSILTSGFWAVLGHSASSTFQTEEIRALIPIPIVYL